MAQPRPMMASPAHDQPARICMPTWRRFSRKVYQCGLYEAQDVLVESDHVDLISLQPRHGFHLRDKWHRKLLYHDLTRRLVAVNPGLERVRLTRDYDLFVVFCQNFEELLYLSAIDGWRDRCRTAICWVEEMWAASIPKYRPWLDALGNFDYVFTCTGGSTRLLSQESGRPCHAIAGAVDAFRFTPFPNPPRRLVDVYSIGRRSEATHQALLSLVDSSQLFYVYDTLRVADTEATDHLQHRELLANMAKRSRYFMVAPAKVNLPGETRGQVEIGYRYYEGAAAGCVMLGQAPECADFGDLFDWPEAVIEIRPDGSDLIDTLRALNADERRVETIGRRNAAEALMRHDWVYRWHDILDTIGLPVSQRMLNREARLQRLAQTVLCGEGNERSRAVCR